MAQLRASPTATANVLNGLKKKGLCGPARQRAICHTTPGLPGHFCSHGGSSPVCGGGLQRTEAPNRIPERTRRTRAAQPSRAQCLVACAQQVRLANVGRRLPAGRHRAGRNDRPRSRGRRKILGVDTGEGSLRVCALRVDLAEGVERLAEALSQGAPEADPTRIARLAKAFQARGLAAERRLASLTHVLKLALPLEPTLGPRRPIIRLTPATSGSNGSTTDSGSPGTSRPKNLRLWLETDPCSPNTPSHAARTATESTPQSWKETMSWAHVVAQLHRARPADGGRLVFKGGTALRLIHLGDYRYSADLDFTVLDGSLDEAIDALSEVLIAAKEHAGLPILQLTPSARPSIDFVGPLGAGKPRRIKLDIATDEYVETVARGDGPRRHMERSSGSRPDGCLPDHRDRGRKAALRDPKRPVSRSVRPLSPHQRPQALARRDSAVVREQGTCERGGSESLC